MTDNWIRRLLPFLKIQRRSMVLTFAAALAGAGLAAVTPLLERHIVDDVILTHRSALSPWLGALVTRPCS